MGVHRYSGSHTPARKPIPGQVACPHHQLSPILTHPQLTPLPNCLRQKLMDLTLMLKYFGHPPCIIK